MACAREDPLAETRERLTRMRTQEATYYAVPDYLAAEYQWKLRDGPALHDGDGAAGDGDHINELWRDKICEWCYHVVDHFNFHREVVSYAMAYLDGYLATRTVNRRIFQLASMTALYLAAKLFEPGKLRMASLVELSRGNFTSEHIVTMEEAMLASLRWHVHPPTPSAFCKDFLPLVSGELRPRARHDIGELSRFLIELSVCDYWFVAKKPSSVALAAVINAIELQGSRRVDPRHKVDFLHRVVDVGVDIADDPEIIECYERLREMYDAGGYTPDLGSDAGVRTVTPTGVTNGPDTDESTDEESSEMECA